MKQYKITLLKGDGIGPEIVDEAVKVLNKTAEKRGFSVAYEEAELGGIAIDHTGGSPSGGNYSKMQSIRFGSVRSRGRSQMGESAGQRTVRRLDCLESAGRWGCLPICARR